MPNGDPRDGIFYPTLTPMIDSYCLAEAERAGCFALIVFLLLCGCQCSISLSHGATCWSVICDCGISCHIHLFMNLISLKVILTYV